MVGKRGGRQEMSRLKGGELMTNPDLVSGLLVLGLTGLAWQQSRTFSYYGGVFVDWVLLILGGLGLLLVIKACADLRMGKEALRLSLKNSGSVMTLLFSLVLYIFLLPRLGFLLSGMIILSGISLLLTPGKKNLPKNWVAAAALSLILTAMFYFIFKTGLSVPLPVGTFWTR